jgi:hypothetical protein
MSGSYLCGAVHFQINGLFEHMAHCHCSICRETHGAPFATYAACSAAQFLWARGEDHIDVFKLADAKHFTVAFCRSCGSTMPRKDPVCAIAMSALDDDPRIATSSLAEKPSVVHAGRPPAEIRRPCKLIRTSCLHP